MQLAVAGLDREGVRDQTRRLASGDWSSFKPSEQVAFAVARRMADPRALRPEDHRRLVEHFGPETALDVIWWVCRCHYMTRIADAFQLPLEESNVFDGFARREAP